MTIKNYGLMWEREAVHWFGQKGNVGFLSGKGPIGYSKKNQIDVDFREQVGVYILYHNDQVIYVGQAGSGSHDLYSRLKNHLTDHLADRWSKFSWFGIRKVNEDGTLRVTTGEFSRSITSGDLLDLLEGLMIKTLEPNLNRQGARWKNIHQYRQTKWGWDNWSEAELLVEIASKLGIDPELD